MTDSEFHSAIEQLKLCVVIPSYNNDKTLKRVIDGVLRYTSHIIVVNDGSTDTTESILAGYPQLDIIRLPENKGKGNALIQGFCRAKAKGYRQVITD